MRDKSFTTEEIAVNRGQVYYSYEVFFFIVIGACVDLYNVFQL